MLIILIKGKSIEKMNNGSSSSIVNSTSNCVKSTNIDERIISNNNEENISLSSESNYKRKRFICH
ncbi:unnamed protein product, partial [Rotaria sp. Silwood2]